MSASPDPWAYLRWLAAEPEPEPEPDAHQRCVEAAIEVFIREGHSDLVIAKLVRDGFGIRTGTCASATALGDLIRAVRAEVEMIQRVAPRLPRSGSVLGLLRELDELRRESARNQFLPLTRERDEARRERDELRRDRDQLIALIKESVTDE